MLKFIGIYILIFGELIYSVYAPPKSTNFSVMFFTSMWLSVFIVSLDGYLFNYSKILKYGFIVSGLMAFVFLFVELIKINMPYEEYIQSVNDKYLNFAIHLLMGIFLLVISVETIIKFTRKCQNQRKE